MTATTSPDAASDHCPAVVAFSKSSLSKLSTCVGLLQQGRYHASVSACSETTLIGESWLHISTPQGIWTRVPCDGKQMGSLLDQWDMVRMKWDCRLSTGLPPAADSVGCEAGRETCSERETGTGNLCKIKWGYHIVVWWGPNDGSGRCLPQTRPQWSITSGSLM
jgi:hypothetical protein